MVEKVRTRPGTITVIAGTNGAGKSSILGAYLRKRGGAYFNPDEVARQLRERHPGLDPTEANALAWSAGRDLLAAAIERGYDHVFETTLGGHTIPRLLADAAAHGHRIVIWYIGLDVPETHVQRVAQRVRRGGHPIPAARIRERFTRSRENLVLLLPVLHECRLFDNSDSVDMDKGEAPKPVSLLHVCDGEILQRIDLRKVPEWAKPVLATCLADKP